MTRVCAAMTDALTAHPEGGDDVKAIVFLQDGKRGGIQMHGYEDDAEAMSDLFTHVKAVFAAHGQDLSLHMIREPGQG